MLSRKRGLRGRRAGSECDAEFIEAEHRATMRGDQVLYSDRASSLAHKLMNTVRCF
jgi:hypothetical protein